MLIHVRPVWLTVIGQVQIQRLCCSRLVAVGGICGHALVSQVLVGVVLVLAVRRKVQERQLLVTAL